MWSTKSYGKKTKAESKTNWKERWRSFEKKTGRKTKILTMTFWHVWGSENICSSRYSSSIQFSFICIAPNHYNSRLRALFNNDWNIIFTTIWAYLLSFWKGCDTDLCLCDRDLGPSKDFFSFTLCFFCCPIHEKDLSFSVFHVFIQIGDVAAIVENFLPTHIMLTVFSSTAVKYVMLRFLTAWSLQGSA